jgi:putative hydrolase of the HAD superfamily
MSALRAVLFDWGDTLFAGPDAAQVIVDAARDADVAVDPDTAQRTWDELWARGKTAGEHAKGRDLSVAAHREVWTALFAPADALVPGASRALYERVMDPASWSPYPDTEPTLRALRERGLRIGVVSNVPADLRAIFEARGLGGTVDTFVLSYQRLLVKPDPRMFRLACVELGVAADEVLMVGDDPISDGGAASIGMEVLILPPPPRGATHSRGLDAVMARVEQRAAEAARSH